MPVQHFAEVREESVCSFCCRVEVRDIGDLAIGQELLINARATADENFDLLLLLCLDFDQRGVQFLEAVDDNCAFDGVMRIASQDDIGAAR